MDQGYIFGAGTGKTYADIKRLRDIAEKFGKSSSTMPQNAMQGMHAVADALISRSKTRKADKLQDTLTSQLGPTNPIVLSLMGIPQSAVPKYRFGTNFHPGGPAIVGEDGPELLMLPKGAKVQPNPATLAQGLVQTADSGEIKSDALPYGDAKLTEGQSKDINYYRRGFAANQELDNSEKALTQFTDSFAGNFGGVGRLFQDAEYQVADRAAKEFLAMVLRKDTGAAVTKQEFDMYSPMYIPEPGDKPEKLAAKRQARQQFLSGMEMGSGTAAPLYGKARTEVGEMSDDDLLRALGGGS